MVQFLNLPFTTDSTFPQDCWYVLVLSQIPPVLYKLLRPQTIAVPRPWLLSSAHAFAWRKLPAMHPPPALTLQNSDGCPLDECSLCSLGVLISIASHSRGIFRNTLQSSSRVTYSWSNCGESLHLKKILKHVVKFCKAKSPFWTYAHTHVHLNSHVWVHHQETQWDMFKANGAAADNSSNSCLHSKMNQTNILCSKYLFIQWHLNSAWKFQRANKMFWN